MLLKLIFITVFTGCSAIIAIQDFRTRFISVGIILLFIAACVISVFCLTGPYSLLSNLISTMLCFSFWYIACILIYSLKEKKLDLLIGKISLGDILVILPIGLTLDVIPLIFFFTATSIIAAFIGFFILKDKVVPYAGMLTIFFTMYKSWEYFG